MKKSAFAYGCCIVLVGEVFAQPRGGSTWTQAVQGLQAGFTGPIAAGLAVVAIIIAGPMLVFGESVAQRTLAGIVFAVGVTVGAINFMSWVFP